MCKRSVHGAQTQRQAMPCLRSRGVFCRPANLNPWPGRAWLSCWLSCRQHCLLSQFGWPAGPMKTFNTIFRDVRDQKRVPPAHLPYRFHRDGPPSPSIFLYCFCCQCVVNIRDATVACRLLCRCCHRRMLPKLVCLGHLPRLGVSVRVAPLV